MENRSTPDHYLYYDHPDRFFLDNVCLKIVAKDERGVFLIFEKTIFHPQGGGQPDDEGVIYIGGKPYPVIGLEETSQGVRHYIKLDRISPFSVGCQVSMQIDKEKRNLFSRYHTAGHLLADTIEKRYPCWKVYKGNHFPGQAAVVLKNHDGSMPLPITEEKKQEVLDFLHYDLESILRKKGSVSSFIEKGVRKVALPGFSPCSCGGSHVRDISSVGGISITKLKMKKKEGLKFSYTLP